MWFPFDLRHSGRRPKVRSLRSGRGNSDPSAAEPIRLPTTLIEVGDRFDGLAHYAMIGRGLATRVASDFEARTGSSSSSAERRGGADDLSALRIDRDDTTDLPHRIGLSRFNCRSCPSLFNERTGSGFNEFHYPTDIVLLAVLWRLCYKLGFRDVAELLLQRGYEVTHETIRGWEARFAPLLGERLGAKRRGSSTSAANTSSMTSARPSFQNSSLTRRTMALLSSVPIPRPPNALTSVARGEADQLLRRLARRAAAAART